jgi:hypothetical protein
MLPSRVPVCFIYRRFTIQVFLCNWISRLGRCCQGLKKMTYHLWSLNFWFFGRKIVKQIGGICQLFQHNEYANCNSVAHTVVAVLGEFMPNFKLDSAPLMWRTKSLRNRSFLGMHKLNPASHCSYCP